jgi:hypothetical protein
MADSGIIVIWSGAIIDIPAGWFLCDGNNGTPDLRARFVFGAGGAVPVGTIGGVSQHNHPFTSNTHYHIFPTGPDMAVGAVYNDNTDATVVTGTTNNTAAIPPFYALAFIMKS